MSKILFTAVICALLLAGIILANREIHFFDKVAEPSKKQGPVPTEQAAENEKAKEEKATEEKVEEKESEGTPQATEPQTASPEPSKEAPKPAGPIELPPPLTGIRFGVSPQAIAGAFKPAWIRETSDELMYVHYLDPTRSRELRFHFVEQRLSAVEMIIRPDRPEHYNDLYNKLLGDFEQHYKNVPRTGTSQWSDGALTARISRQRDAIALIFEHRS